MITNDMDMDLDLVTSLMAEIKDKRYPVQVQTGIPFMERDTGNNMIPIQVSYADDFDFNKILCELINKAFKLE